jgi:hypothetical protein
MADRDEGREGVTYYAAVKWTLKDGPQPRDVANDLQILAMTLLAEWDWSLETVQEMFEDAADAAQGHAEELARERRA